MKRGRESESTSNPLSLQKVKYEFRPKAECDESGTERPYLALNKGNTVLVEKSDKSGWSWGKRYNRHKKKAYGDPGWFPSNYTEPLNDATEEQS
jgi:hypothetical protein